MKIYLQQNVFDAAIERMEWLFDEFENVIVDVSGGKDSTIVFNLAFMVAKKKNRLPLNVLFVDQEVEWSHVIQYIRNIMTNPDVKPYWLQIPIQIFNATSTNDPWLQCWEPGVEWIRAKEEISIKNNIYGTKRFKKLFSAVIDKMYPHSPAIHISGVRCEENMTRFVGLTGAETYKGKTWGKIDNKEKNHFTFYPIYDWSYTDVWKAIHDNNWEYCKIYDYQYQYGIKPVNMRISNLNHETAITNLLYLQEVESETWNKVTQRLSGINTLGQLRDFWFVPEELPYMFSCWKEYRDYILEKLITDNSIRAKFSAKFKSLEDKCAFNNILYEKLIKATINTILRNDFEFTLLGNFVAKMVPSEKTKRRMQSA